MSDAVLDARPIGERMRLDGRVALVTGGGNGIGRAFAHALGEAGAAVAVVDIVKDRAETVAAELSGKGIDAVAVVADVTQAADVRDMVDAVVSHWGKLTIGVNNAGIGQWGEALTLPEESWDRIIDVNLKGVFLCCQAEGRVMVKAGYGKVINTASMSARIVNTPQPQVPYNASKAGVVHLTRSLAAEWATHGVRVNSISPGYIWTPLLEEVLKPAAVGHLAERWKEFTPQGRFGQVTDLQGAVVYLASETSDFMTGSDVVIDGGYTVW